VVAFWPISLGQKRQKEPQLQGPTQVGPFSAQVWKKKAQREAQDRRRDIWDLPERLVRELVHSSVTLYPMLTGADFL
jgi:hypothetical protein